MGRREHLDVCWMILMLLLVLFEVSGWESPGWYGVKMVVWQIRAGKCGMTTLLSILLSLHEVDVLTGVCYAYLVLMIECQ